MDLYQILGIGRPLEKKSTSKAPVDYLFGNVTEVTAVSKSVRKFTQ